MINNTVYARMVKWTETYSPYRSFIILWSDHTWDEFKLVPNEDKFGFSDVKKHFNLAYLTSKHICKEEALKYITTKIKEIEA